MTDVALPAPRPLVLNYQSIVNAAVAVFVFFGMLSLIEPSPYDFLSFVAIPLWAIGGFRVHRGLVPIIFLWTVFEFAGFLALMPFWDDKGAQLYQFQSLYLFCTLIFFAIFFSERTIERGTVCLKAYAAGAIVCAIVGFIGYFDIGGFGKALTTFEGRVSGTFKDPNVFGSYLILAITYLLQTLLLGTSRWTLSIWVMLGFLLIGDFVSFSRGSWGATLVAMLLVTVSAYLTADDSALRRRIVRMTAIAGLLSILGFGGLLTASNVREFFFQRAEVTQDYDEGVTGRFGNQIRSIPMLVQRPEGFGPLQFRTFFGLEPHSSYIGGFANGGWLGGFAWIGIVLTSCFVGFRLMFVFSPYRRLAQAFTPPLFVLLMQGFQIDVDHWRHVFLLLGAVWGLEAARLRWLGERVPFDGESSPRHEDLVGAT